MLNFDDQAAYDQWYRSLVWPKFFTLDVRFLAEIELLILARGMSV